MNTIKNIKTLKAAISRYELRVTRIERKSDREIIFFARRTSGTRNGSLRNQRVAELNYADAVELHAAGRLRKHPPLALPASLPNYLRHGFDPRATFMKTHGGKRPGAGRKKGTGKGRTAITKSISMSVESWRKLDVTRGSWSRGKYLTSLLDQQ
jgi:hypothetical protein